MMETTSVFFLELLLWKVLLEDGAVVTHIRATTARTPLIWTQTRIVPTG